MNLRKNVLWCFSATLLFVALSTSCTKSNLAHKHAFWVTNATNQELVVKYSVDGKPMIALVSNAQMYNHTELALPVYAAGARIEHRWSKEELNVAFDYIHVYKLSNSKDTSTTFVDIKDYDKLSIEDNQVKVGDVTEIGHRYKYFFEYIFP
jgi:hypothetical protein